MWKCNDEFDMQRLKKTKEELRNINNEICETAVKSAPDIDTSKIVSLLKNMREEIFAKKIATTQNKLLNCL